MASQAKQRSNKQPKIKPYTGPAGGWGSVQSLAKSLTREHIPVSGSRVLLHQNKTGGFMCVSCAWAKPDPLPRFRDLRKRRQGNHLGADQQADDAGILCRAHLRRT